MGVIAVLVKYGLRYEAWRGNSRLRNVVLMSVVFLALSVFYISSIDIRATRGSSITGDEPFYLMTTQSLLEDGNLDIGPQYASKSYKAFFDHEKDLWQQSVAMPDETVLSPHNPGLSVLLIPGFALGGLLGVQVQMLIIAGVTFALTYLLVFRITGAEVVSLVATLLVGISATAYIYATEIYPEYPAGLMLVIVLLLIQGIPRIGMIRMLVLVMCLTLIPWLGVKYVPLVGLLGIWVLFKMGPLARIVFLFLGLISGCIFVVFHVETFGGLTPYTIGAVYAGDDTLTIIDKHFSFDGRVYRLLGLFVDQRFGIARWAPVLLLVPVGVSVSLFRSSETRWIAGLICAQICIASFVAVTMMGWWFPGRTLMTVVPLMAVLLAVIIGEANLVGRVFIAVLGVYSLMITLALMVGGHLEQIVIAVDPFKLPSPLIQLSSGLFPNYEWWSTETWLLTMLWASLFGGGVCWVIAKNVKALGVNWKGDRNGT